ncbi:MAG: type VI secretion system tip protein VgrG [Azoarcus sp.]|jgi:type VI secretion system secreted protein VgrG|nr:type VI secretion system tip protein VgrG [Azoarcus sp.]
MMDIPSDLTSAGNLAGKASAVSDLASNAAGAAGDLAGNAMGAVSDMAGSAVGAASDLASNAAGAVGNMASNAVGAASDLASNAAGTVGDMAGNAMGAASDMAGNAAGALGSIGDAAGNALGSISNLAGGAVASALGGMATGMAGNLLGGLLAAFASAFQQTNRLVKLKLGDGQQYGQTLLPQTAVGEESLSATYRYEVTCLSPDATLPLEPLLGQLAQLDILTSAGGIADMLTPIKGQKNVLRCGIVTRAEALPSDGGFARYLLVIEPAFALLRHRRTSRVFQDKTVPDIVKTILDEHIRDNGVIGATFGYRFEIKEENHPERSYCLQYRETDLDYIERLLAEEGLTYRFEHADSERRAPGRDENRAEDEYGDDAESDDETGDDGEAESKLPNVTLVVFDNAYSVPRARQGAIRFHRANATESSDSLTLWTRAQEAGVQKTSLASFDYKPVLTHGGEDECPYEREKLSTEATLEDYDAQTHYYGKDSDELTRHARRRQAVRDREKRALQGGGNVRELKAGEWFELTGHPVYEMLPEENRRFVVTRLAFTAHSNLPSPLSQYLTPEKPPLPPPYRVDFAAQTRGAPLYPAYGHTKHARPTSPGIQTATVVGPREEKEVFTDDMGRIKVQFHWQRDQEHPEFGAALDERSSCWLRVAYPSAGAGWGHQFIPRVGQEVLIDFIESDIDRPIVTGVIHNGAHPPPYFSGAGQLPANRTLSGIKTKEHNGEQYNELLFDDTQDEVRAKLSSEHGKTQLNQGFLIHPRTDGAGEPRGEGFELRTDRAGAIRATEGILLTTEPQPAATGRQLDRKQVVAQLAAARELIENLSEVAAHQLADAVETGPGLRDEEGGEQGKAAMGHLDHLIESIVAWEARSNTDPDAKSAASQPGRQGVLAMHAERGISMTSPEEIALATEKNFYLANQRDMQQSTGRRWIHNVGKKISFFVHGAADKVNLKLVAAKGHAKFWAQSGDVEIIGDQNVRIYANKKQFLAVAKEEMLLTCAGAYIRLKGGNIDIHAPGKVSVKGANHSFDGPTSLEMQGPNAPEPTLKKMKTGQMLHFSG